MEGYDGKIRRILQQLLEPNGKGISDVYLNSLLVFLAGNAEETRAKLNEETHQMFPQWILHAIELWEQQAPSPAILSFGMNLAANLVQKPEIFKLLEQNRANERLLNLSKLNSSSTTPTVKLAGLKLLTAYLEHAEGLEFLMSNKFWAEALSLCLTNQTVYITKVGHRFLAKLLESTVNVNQNFTIGVIQRLIEPINETSFQNISLNRGEVLEISDETIHKTVSPTLCLLSQIFEYYLENAVSAKDFNTMSIFMKFCNLEACIDNFLLVAHNKDFVFELHKVLYLMVFLESILLSKSGVVTCQQKRSILAKKMYKIFVGNISKGFTHNVLKFCYLGHIYWKQCTFISVLSVERTDHEERHLFINQLMVLLLVPHVIISIKFLGLKHIDENSDEFRDEFFDKILKIISVPTLRVAYQWKSMLGNSGMIFENGSLTLQYILKVKKFYTKEIGASMFQSLMYSLSDMVEVLKNQRGNVEMLLKEYNFFGLLLEAIAVYIEEFELTWRDSYETTSVMNLAFDFLSVPAWPPKVVVKALKLVDISISKYMSPNLALLIDRINDSTMAFIGPLLYAKLHDASWEVRDSSLEVLCTISSNAKTKFPSFQRVILDSDLSGLVVRITQKDSNGFVRSTAFKCLQEMSQVEEFWTNILQNHDLIKITLDVLRQETEGIVRKEAASLIGTLFEHNRFSSEQLSTVYDFMTHAAIADLHWEVKVSSLNFWNILIKHNLQLQGMIDGTFPSAVFSKEHRKIVTLTELETKRRIIKVLQLLNETGCLYVLATCIQDDCDLEVSKTSTTITQSLVELLKKYKVTLDDLSPSCDDGGVPMCLEPDTTPIDFTMDKIQSKQIDEEILEDILGSKDEALLKNLTSPSDQFTGNVMPLHGKRLWNPRDFVRFTETDLEARIREKQNWLRNIDEFGSLLDDILKEYEGTNGDDQVNRMDCY